MGSNLYVPGDVHLSGTNTFASGGRQDFRSQNGIYVPVAAGLAPSTQGEFGFDSTQRSFRTHDGKVNGGFNRCLYATRSTTDTVDADTVGTTETAFAGSYQFPASYFIANKALLVVAGFRLVTPASAFTTTLITLRMQKAGPTNVSLYSAGTATAASLTRNYLFMWMLQGTAAPGAAVAIECEQIHGDGNWNPAMPNTVDAAANVDTTAAQTLQFTVTYGADPGAAQTLTLRQLVITELN